MSNDDLDTLRPEVREAVDAFDIGARVGMTFGNKTWNTIRAELLRLVAENHELRAGREQARNDRVDEIRQRVDAEAELAALKARLADAPVIEVKPATTMFRFGDHARGIVVATTPSGFIGKSVRLVVED